ncbi:MULTISPECIES: T9SS type A sorting domain-containing protein [Chryseobacterium]|uniref:Fibronectin type-III domain-containing protein n=1 Tax=Chryseobacterium geocarposphaerae TaxID=1416776 RepID=A0ABU1LHQ8_9FLAO|nr:MULTISPECIES: T9SS type A sorting domain-containing protein [Chryseobacterium]MDR6406248.1 hypothetical protein [Chryseobacterium geocarposphaerae]MDR6699732.1 hypothetical protein [Chryseobacterium ginsenosidimutans]
MKHFYKSFSLPERGKKFFTRTILGVALFLGIYNTAQVSTYSFTQSAGSFSAISGTNLDIATGNTSTTNLNSAVYPVTLPFNFVFNGISYSSMNVSTNGFVTFGATAPSTTTTTPISSTTAYEGAIAAFGRDISSMYEINGTTGSISWETLGTAPNREVVVQWKNFRPNSSTSVTAAYAFAFQIRLHETTNVINTVYDTGGYIIGNTALSGTVQIGLRGNSNADFNNRLNATSLEFISSTPGTANSSTQNFHTINAVPGMPTAGLTYTWTPPTCWVPQTLTVVSTATNSANITWQAPSTAPASYDIYYSTLSTPPTSSTPPTMPNFAGTTATLSPLTAATTYYVWVRSNCGSGNFSAWSLLPVQFTTQCQPPVVSSTTQATVCPGSTATLSAVTTDPAAVLTWYDASSGGNVVGTGSTFTTPALSVTTPYYVSATNGTSMFVGPATPNSMAAPAITGAINTYYIQFEVTNQPLTLVSIDVFPESAGQSTTLEILQGPTSFSVINTIPFTSTIASDGTTPQTVPINMTLTPGTYRMRMSGGDYYRNYQSNAVFPYSIPNFSITTGSNAASDSYYFMYNLKVNSGCESPRTTVTATVDANCLSTSEVKSKDLLKVYPNPFTDVINIDRPEMVKSIQVTDVSGKLIKNNVKAESVLRFNDLSQGLYILILDMKDGTKQSIKVIKK